MHIIAQLCPSSGDTINPQQKRRTASSSLKVLLLHNNGILQDSSTVLVLSLCCSLFPFRTELALGQKHSPFPAAYTCTQCYTHAHTGRHSLCAFAPPFTTHACSHMMQQRLGSDFHRLCSTTHTYVALRCAVLCLCNEQ